MPTYQYTARDESGKTIRGNQEAVGEPAALAILQGKGLYVTEISSAAADRRIVGGRNAKKRHRRVKPDDMLFFIQQSANLLIAGIPFVRTLELISAQTDSQKLYDTIQELIRNIREGSSYKDAMARHPNVFPEFWLYLIEAGEVSGTLPQVLMQIAKNLQAGQRLKSKVVSALIYPGVLITASAAAIMAMMLFVIPTFEKVFKSFNAQLPPLTQLILDISNFLRAYFFFIAGAVIALAFALKNYVKTPGGKRMLHALLLNLPIFGNVVRDIIHARISLTLTMLIRSGLNFLKTIDITANVAGNVFFETALSNVKSEVQAGKPFSASIKDDPLFSSMFANLVSIGEESGKLPDMVEKAAEYYEQRTEIFASRIGVLIEPVVMLIVGGIIGVIVVAMFMPILNMSKIIK